jgi:hypothetical protein
MSIRFPIKVEAVFEADISADPSTWPTPEDISAYCYVREGGYTSRRGRSGWQVGGQPGGFDLLLNNRDGRFSRLNPLGAYYGRLRTNTPIVVSVDPGSGYVVRATGFVSDWPVEWNLAESDFWVRVRADDPMRRAFQGSQPLRSRMTRTLIGFAKAGALVAHWPCEDGAEAVGAADLLGGRPLLPPTAVQFDAVTPPVGISAAPDISNSLLYALVAGPSPGFAANVASGSNPTDSVRWSAVVEASGVLVFGLTTAANSITYYAQVNASTVTLFRSDTGATVCTATISVADGEWHDYAVAITPVGADLLVTLTVDLASDTQLVTGKGRAPITAVAANPQKSADVTSAAQIAVSDWIAFSADATLMNGFPGEEAAIRFGSYCTSAQIPYDYTGNGDEVTLGYYMGPDRQVTIATGLQECEGAVEGVIFARADGVLFLQTAADRENLEPALALDYDQRHIYEPFGASDDDRLIRNDVTVTIPGGSYARVADATSAMGTNPTTGAGRYDEEVSRNVEDLQAATDHAGWRVNLGTVNEYRYPTVDLKLHSPNLAALLADIVTVDIGSRITIANLPANLPPDLVDLIVEGVNERCDEQAWTVEFVCSPYKPYKIFEISDTTADANTYAGRLAGDEKAAIRMAIDDNDLSIEFDPNRYRWTTVADDFDPDLRIRFGGETADISTIATTAGTYVAAGAASHADNAAITPALYAGGTARDLICLLTRYASSAGTIDVPGYTLLGTVAELALYGKVHSGSESNPTVTPTDGSAGDVLSGFTFGFRGTPSTLTSLADIVVTMLPLSNTSAQDIAYNGVYPRYQEGTIVLLVAGKADDWTSVAVPAGLTEIAEPSTTTGSDQGLYAAYQIQTTPAVVPAGSLVATGGGSAVSESMMFVLAAGYQTMTVAARSVNGCVKAHTTGTKIEVENAHVLGL